MVCETCVFYDLVPTGYNDAEHFTVPKGLRPHTRHPNSARRNRCGARRLLDFRMARATARTPSKGLHFLFGCGGTLGVTCSLRCGALARGSEFDLVIPRTC